MQAFHQTKSLKVKDIQQKLREIVRVTQTNQLS